MSQSVLLPPGPFTRRQAQAVTTAYSNITLEDDQAVTSAWWFETLKAGCSGGHGTLNRMPVKVLTAISAPQASIQAPPPADREAFTRNISPARTPFISPYASHRRWRFY